VNRTGFSAGRFKASLLPNALAEKSIESFMRFKILLFLMRIYSRIILRCESQIFQLLRIKIQQYFLSNHKEATIAKIYKISHLTCLKYLQGKIPDEYIAFQKQESGLFKRADELVEQRKDLRDLLVHYFRVKSFYYISCIETELLRTESDKYYKKATEISESIPRLERKGFTQLNKEIQKEYRKSKKELNKQTKEFIAEATYEILPRIEISTSHISFIFSISATIFLLTGYLYNRFYLGHFGIEVSHFFTISDYISSSIDKIYIACIASIIGIFTYVGGMLSRIKNEVKFSQYESEYKASDSYIVILVVGISFLTVWSFYKGVPGKFGLLSMLILFVLMGIYHRLPVEKLIKNSIYVSIICVAIIYFCVHIFWDVTKNIEKTSHMKPENLNKYTFSFKKPGSNCFNKLIFLSANSNYIFFYDKEKNKSYIMPKNEIAIIETK